MNEQQIKINSLADTLGFFLLEKSIPTIKSAHQDLKPSIFPYPKIKDAFNTYGLSNLIVSEYDYNFAFLDAKTFEPLIWKVMTFLHKIGYEYDFMDCDNFAFACSVLMSMLFGINTCGVVWCEVWDKQMGVKLGGHYFNIPIIYDSIFKKFELWIADPLNPGFEKIEKGSPIILNDWEYRNLANAKFF